MRLYEHEHGLGLLRRRLNAGPDHGVTIAAALVWKCTSEMFILASSSKTYELLRTVIITDTGSFVCHITSRSLQPSYGVCAKEGYRQVATRLQNAAARLITGTQKHKRGLPRLLRDDLHWLTIPQWVQYKLAMTVHQCLRYRAPRYLAYCCVPASEVSGRQHLHSASRRKLNIPRFRRNTFGTCRLSQSPVRRFGTHCLIRYTIRPSSPNVLGGT